jgi:hypothetical protein
VVSTYLHNNAKKRRIKAHWSLFQTRSWQHYWGIKDKHRYLYHRQATLIVLLPRCIYLRSVLGKTLCLLLYLPLGMNLFAPSERGKPCWPLQHYPRGLILPLGYKVHSTFKYHIFKHLFYSFLHFDLCKKVISVQCFSTQNRTSKCFLPKQHSTMIHWFDTSAFTENRLSWLPLCWNWVHMNTPM